MYTNAWPFEHLVYVEMPSHDDKCNPLPINGNKFYNVNGKTFYFLMQKHVELMEYTGLKDSNDREIFEGDIIKTDWGNTGPSFVGRVYWHETEFQWWITDDTKDPIAGVDYDLTFLSSYLTYNVIGNIYEHPELLGRKG
jgi:uncharacterized phage protein (TIGR01671 family)